MTAITVKGLSYAYRIGGRQILRNLNFQVQPGEVVAIIGLSGCGKSTLCHCLGGIIPHYLGGDMSGQVWVNGKDTRAYKVAQLAQEVGVVFQDPDTQLFSPTVEDEIAFAPENLCLPPEQIRQRVQEILEMLRITELSAENPNHLSGGQKHLVALAAVLSLDPGILVMDEVMGHLDQGGQELISSRIESLRRHGKSVILVEHDLARVAIADWVLVLEDGLLIREGRTAEVLGDETFLSRHKLKFKTK